MNFRAKGNKPLDFDMRCRDQVHTQAGVVY